MVGCPLHWQDYEGFPTHGGPPADWEAAPAAARQRMELPPPPTPHSACSLLPHNYGNLPLPFSWGNLYGSFTRFYYIKLP